MKSLTKAACFLTLLLYAGSASGTETVFEFNDDFDSSTCESAAPEGLSGTWKPAGIRNLDTCKLNEDVDVLGGARITIFRDDMILDGAGYTLYGYLGSSCVHLVNATNVTVKDLYVSGCSMGIRVDESNSNTIKGIETGGTGFERGIYVEFSNFNTIKQNEISQSNYGIVLESSGDNSIKFNCIERIWSTAIELEGTSMSNSIKENNIGSTTDYIVLESNTSENSVVRNRCNTFPTPCIVTDSGTDNKVVNNNKPLDARRCPDVAE